ncbi:MAG TPA: YicC/YloC family endoribonuclease [Stellaceae bacterium]|nr:YicC/YloC family endoribonuclease [Stellaceae bacterium]
MAALSSMTGFARAEGSGDGFAWAWELKSVNGKALDLRFRLPHAYDAVEQKLKVLAGDTLRRGSVTASLSVTETERPAELRINRLVLDQLMALCQSLEGAVAAAAPRLDGLLSIRGVIELAEHVMTPEELAVRHAAAEAGFAAALAALLESRNAEGARLGRVLADRLDEIATLVGEAEQSAALQPEAIRARFGRQMAELLGATSPVAPERLAAEVALLIQRADVREELDRLHSHIAAARELLAEGSGIGRRLDFLCQEFNREANTVCSKASELGLTRLGLALKSAIEQLREQIQNIE